MLLFFSELGEASEIKLTSLNVNGVGSQEKRVCIMAHVRSLDSDLVVLVDTRLSALKSRKLENEADDFQWFFTNGISVNGGSISRGVAIGIKKNSLINPGEGRVVAAGNALKVNFKFEGHEFIIFGIYGPSDSDNPRFFEAIFNESETSTETYKILAGDFNVPLNFQKDTNCTQDSRKRAREKINEKMLDQRLKDIYRVKKGIRELFTYSNKDENRQSRLDYFLVSENLVQNVSRVSEGNFFRSDHRNVDMYINFSNIKAGKKRWRYSQAMRRDDSLRAKITRELYESLFRYVDWGEGGRPPDRTDFLRKEPPELLTYRYTIGWGELLNVTLIRR